jgi:hypothetical protein
MDTKFTCPICDFVIFLINDGMIHYCDCGSLGIDSTSEYTRIIGCIPKENKNYEEFMKKKGDIVNKLRDIFRSKRSIGVK